MRHPLLHYRVAAVTALLLTSGLSQAQTPSEQPPLFGGEPARTPGVGYPAPPIGYPAPGNRPMPLRGPEPNMAASGPAESFAFAGMRLTQQRDEDTYRLDIELNGLDPSQVRVLPAGYALAIIAAQSAQTNREETFADGRGFRRSYSWSSGQSTKRLPVPPDGDLVAMRREDRDGSIRIVIPRRKATAVAPPNALPAANNNQQRQQRQQASEQQ